MSKRTTDRNFFKSFCQSVQIRTALKIRTRKKRIAIAKLFGLHANATRQAYLAFKYAKLTIKTVEKDLKDV